MFFPKTNTLNQPSFNRHFWRFSLTYLIISSLTGEHKETKKNRGNSICLNRETFGKTNATKFVMTPYAQSRKFSRKKAPSVPPLSAIQFFLHILATLILPWLSPAQISATFAKLLCMLLHCPSHFLVFSEKKTFVLPPPPPQFPLNYPDCLLCNSLFLSFICFFCQIFAFSNRFCCKNRNTLVIIAQFIPRLSILIQSATFAILRRKNEQKYTDFFPFDSLIFIEKTITTLNIKASPINMLRLTDSADFGFFRLVSI